MKKLSLIIFIAIISCFNGFSQTNSGDYFKIGYDQLGRKENDAAIVSFSNCLKLEPYNWQCLHNRALAYQRLGNINSALADLTSSIRVSPNTSNSYVSRGDLYVKDLKNYDLALLDYNRAIQLKVNNAETFNNRGLILNKKGRYQEAIIDFNRAISLKLNYWNPFYGRAEAYCKLGKTDLAAHDEKRVVELGGKINKPCANNEMSETETEFLSSLDRAALLESKGEFNEALIEYTDLIKNHPKETLPYLNRAKLYHYLKKNDLALADLDKVLSLNPKDKEASELKLKIMAGQVADYIFKNDNLKSTTPISIFNEQFNDNKNGWVTGKNENSELIVKNGIYSIETKNSGANTIWLPLEKAPKIDQTRDFRIRAKFRLLNGLNQNAVGLVWGVVDGGNMFELAIRPDGTWFYGQRRNGQNPRALERNTSPDLAKGINSANEITISKVGKSLLIYLNGRLNEEVQFETFNSASTLGFVLYGANKIEVEYLTVEQK